MPVQFGDTQPPAASAEEGAMVILHTDDVVWVRLPTRIPLVLSVWPDGAWWDWGAWSGQVVVGRA